MNRREFLATSAVAAAGTTAISAPEAKTPGYASPSAAMKAPRETVLFVTCVATDANKPDYLAVVDADPNSATYSQVIQRLKMPNPGDELHHFGWNICSSCHGQPGDRRYLIVPGLKSSRIHIVDAENPKALKITKVIEPEAVKKHGLSGPHTVHCLPTGEVMISMLGNAEGNSPGGFLLLDSEFNIKGQWENVKGGVPFNYDFWYQPKHNVVVSSQWASPNTYWSGFNPKDVAGGKYGNNLLIWNWKDRTIDAVQSLGDEGHLPLEVRFQHNPDGVHAFVGIALSSNIWNVHKNSAGKWETRKLIQVEPFATKGDPVPGVITDLLVSMDDRFLYFSNWLQGDIRQYDISNPLQPKLVGQLYLGGVIGKAPEFRGKKLGGGPQMLQLSLDGKRLYATNSLLSKWDDQFYPDLAKAGSWLLQIDVDTEKGGLKLNDKFFVDFGKEPDGPVRAHETRYPGGDCTSDIFS